MGIIVDNEIVNSIEDIIPVRDRIIVLRLKGAMPITIVGACIPQGYRPKEEKEHTYKELEAKIRKSKAKGQIYILGDMNARIQKAEGTEETKTHRRAYIRTRSSE